MNVYDLTTQVMQQCQMDATDATNRTDNQTWIVAAMNEAYRKICRNKVHLWATEEVTLDENRQFALSVLTNTLIRIREITQYPNYSGNTAYGKAMSYRWDMYDSSHIVVMAAPESGTVYVTYEYMPEDLVVTSTSPSTETTTNTPQINAAWHHILTYWATAQYYLGVKSVNYINKGSLWINMYDREYANITDGIGEPEHVGRNAYKSSIL